MYFAFVRTLSIESGNSNLLKLKRERFLKFQLTKGRINTAMLQRLMEPRDKMPPDTPLHLYYCIDMSTSS